MNSASVATPPDPYNYTYRSPLYGEIRSITDLPDFSLSQDTVHIVYDDSTQIAGVFVTGQNNQSKEKYIEATFFKDDLDLAPLADEFIQIYE